MVTCAGAEVTYSNGIVASAKWDEKWNRVKPQRGSELERTAEVRWRRSSAHYGGSGASLTNSNDTGHGANTKSDAARKRLTRSRATADKVLER